MDSSRFHAARVCDRIASKSNAGASASRLRRAPSSSTNDTPKLTVTSPPSSQPTQPPLPIVPLESNGRLKRATKKTGYRPRRQPATSRSPITLKPPSATPSTLRAGSNTSFGAPAGGNV